MHLLRIIFLLYCVFLFVILLINVYVFWNSDFSILFGMENFNFKTWKLELYGGRNSSNSNSSILANGDTEMKGRPLRIVVKSVLKKGSVVDKIIVKIAEEQKSWNDTPAITVKHRTPICTLPNYQPWDFNKPYDGPGVKHSCKASKDDILFYTDHESNLITSSNRKDCCYESLRNPGTCHSITSKKTKMPEDLTFDLITVRCKNSKSYSQKFAIVNKVLPKYSLDLNATLNVLIIGFQSVSRMNFIREMPQTHKYLTEKLDAFSLQGYSKISDDTFDNLIALHTGGHPNEKVFKNCNQNWDNSRIDGYPFLWEKFSKQGFYTSYSEDSFKKNVYLSHCHYDHLWEKQKKYPTDYFLAKLSKEMEKNKSKTDPICFDKQLAIGIFLDHIEKLATTYSKDRYFQFTWQQMVSGEDKNSLELADSVLLKSLKYLDIKGHLKNTALILLSDQGIKAGTFRDTQQGQLENRNPVAYLVLPSFFSKRFPLAMNNLKENTQKLSTPFDMHETIKEFMDLTKLEDNILKQREKTSENEMRGVSLFLHTPEHRNCSGAGIPMHFCLCSPRTPLFSDTLFAMDAAYFILNEINSMIKVVNTNNSVQCVDVKGHAIATALEFTLDDKNFANSYEYGNETVKPNHISKAADSKGIGIQLTLKTRPCDVIYEATVVKLLDGEWFLSSSISITSDISKIPHVGNCTQIPEELRGYCCCKRKK